MSGRHFRLLSASFFPPSIVSSNIRSRIFLFFLRLSALEHKYRDTMKTGERREQVVTANLLNLFVFRLICSDLTALNVVEPIACNIFNPLLGTSSIMMK